MTRKQSKSLAPAVPLNFLLTCSEVTLDNFELAKLAAIANLRSEMHDVLDKIISEGIEAGLARWFKVHGREEIKHAVENPPDVLAEAREAIRTRGRSAEELALIEARRGRKPGEPAQLPAQRFAPGKAQVAAVRRYKERNIEDGKCCFCPRPLAPNSKRMCEEHLAYRQKWQAKRKGKGDD